ncbi:OmpA family protein [Candidatus Methylacidiphilum infernorum]|uniref:OmpA family protein n=2 Tax=Candidatus Methylacidiphilum infernorum TaxID=511746 RepID=A0ABX7PUE9_9BACT|nr:OmpA family protein [Candidatus Methylacidiphilum infernorum]
MMKTEPFSPFSVILDRKTLSLAVILSLLLHLAFIVTVGPLRIKNLALASTAKKFDRRLDLKRAELPASIFQARADTQSPSVTPIPALEAPKQIKAINPLVQDVTQANPVRIPMPSVVPGGAPEVAVLSPTPPTEVSPYQEDPKSHFQTLISHLLTGQTSPGVPNTSNILPAGLGHDPIPGASAPGQAGTHPTGTSGGEGIPGVDDIQTQFKAAANFDPRVPQPVVLRLPSDILFDFDSATIKPNAESLLFQVLEILKKYNRADVEIGGHTDTFGDEMYNLQLSEQRAFAVQQWLEAHLPQGMYNFHATGYGKSHPIVNPHGSIEEQARNRRVEIVIRALVEE